MIGIELIGTTMSSFEKKASTQNAVCSQQIGNYGKNELLILFSFIYVVSMKSESN